MHGGFLQPVGIPKVVQRWKVTLDTSGAHWLPMGLPEIPRVTLHSIGHSMDVIKWKHFPRYWPFVRGIHRSPVNSPHKGQWGGALMFTLICARINGWVNNREAGDLRRHRAHYDVIVMDRGRQSIAQPTPQANCLPLELCKGTVKEFTFYDIREWMGPGAQSLLRQWCWVEFHPASLSEGWQWHRNTIDHDQLMVHSESHIIRDNDDPVSIEGPEDRCNKRNIDLLESIRYAWIIR